MIGQGRARGRHRRTARLTTLSYFAVTYGDGSSTSGPVYTETIQMAGYYADQQYFSPVNQLSDSFASDPEDGSVCHCWTRRSSH